MSKENEEKIEISLTGAQCKEIAQEIEKAGGLDAFLVKEKAIRVDEKGMWFIQKYEGLGKVGIDARFGYKYQNDIPYTFWSEVVDQVKNFLNRMDYAKKMEENHLEETASNINEF